MARSSVRERDLVRGIEELCRRDLDSPALRHEVARRLRRVVDFDSFCFATIDPQTLLLTDAVSEGVEPAAARLATYNEYMVEDVDKYADLARSRRAVGVLSHSTGGDNDRSHRYRTVLSTIDATDEMRAVFLADRDCWGAASLFRHEGRPGFTKHEADLVKAVSRPVAAALRRAATRRRDTTSAPHRPGVVLVDRDGTAVATDEAARRWLDELSPGHIALLEVAEAARSTNGDEAYARVRSRRGQWLSLSGSAIDDRVTVVIQPAPVSDITRMLTLAHALTPREQQVLQTVLYGETAPAIAARLQISPHTVQTHMNAIFEKFEVHSRGDLIARILHESSLI